VGDPLTPSWRVIARVACNATKASPGDRLAVNFVATDLLFTPEKLGIGRQAFGDELARIADDLGGALRDRISAPEVAQHSARLRGQLLLRIP
jgi:hypothetical protein